MAPAVSIPADVADLARAAISEGISALRWVVAQRSESTSSVESVRRAATSLLQFTDRILRLPQAAPAPAPTAAAPAAPAHQPPPPAPPAPAAPSPIAMLLARAGADGCPPDPLDSRISALADLAALLPAATFPP
ncbi:MAG: hypothetical protein JNJ48_04205 [Phycisphaerae bacterium]|nr:hypothetical protein [Phycisphaerae bacterium]